MQMIEGLGRQIKLQKGLINGKVRQEVQQLTAAYHQATRNGGTTADFQRLISDRIEVPPMLMLERTGELPVPAAIEKLFTAATIQGPLRLIEWEAVVSPPMRI